MYNNKNSYVHRDKNNKKKHIYTHAIFCTKLYKDTEKKKILIQNFLSNAPQGEKKIVKK